MADSYLTTSPEEAVQRTVKWLRLQRPVLWLGASGIGKSAMVRDDLAREMAAFHEGFDALPVLADIRCAYRDAVDLRGIPVADRETGVTRWLQPEELPMQGPGFIFIDEVGQGLIQVQNSCMQLINDRELGNYKVPDDVYIIAASNREQDGCYIRKMSAALRQRFAVIEITPKAASYRRWAIANDLDIRLIQATAMFPDLIESWDGELSGQQSTSRELTVLNGIITDDSIDMTQATALAYATDVVGESAAIKLVPFIANYEGQVQVRHVVKDPKGCAIPEADRFDNIISLVLALSRAATLKNCGAVLEYIDRLDNQYRALFSSTFETLNEKAKKDGYLADEWSAWYSRNASLTG